MLGMGPILWRLANLKMYGDEQWARDEPVVRLEADTLADGFAHNPRYRYEYPAARLYYQMIDAVGNKAAHSRTAEQR
jgi:hypothetical protein